MMPRRNVRFPHRSNGDPARHASDPSDDEVASSGRGFQTEVSQEEVSGEVIFSSILVASPPAKQTTTEIGRPGSLGL